MTYPMITAHEALAQGSTPSLFFSIARFTQDDAVAATAKARGRELAAVLGMELGGRRYKKSANDNRRRAKARAA